MSSGNEIRNRCIRLDGPAARCSRRPKLPRQFVPVRNFEPRLFVPMPGIMGRPAFTFINLYIFCNLQRIINQNIHFDYVCTVFLLINAPGALTFSKRGALIREKISKLTS